MAEQICHIFFINLIFDEMKDDVERQDEIVHTFIFTTLGSEEEALAGVTSEVAAAQFDRSSRYIDANIAGIARQFQLATVTAAEFENALDAVLCNKTIEHFRLELGEPADGSCA